MSSKRAPCLNSFYLSHGNKNEMFSSEKKKNNNNFCCHKWNKLINGGIVSISFHFSYRSGSHLSRSNIFNFNKQKKILPAAAKSLTKVCLSMWVKSRVKECLLWAALADILELTAVRFYVLLTIYLLAEEKLLNMRTNEWVWNLW